MCPKHVRYVSAKLANLKINTARKLCAASEAKTAVSDNKCCSFLPVIAVNQSPLSKLASPRRKNAFDSWKSPSDSISFTNLSVALSGGVQNHREARNL